VPRPRSPLVVTDPDLRPAVDEEVRDGDVEGAVGARERQRPPVRVVAVDRPVAGVHEHAREVGQLHRTARRGAWGPALRRAG